MRLAGVHSLFTHPGHLASPFRPTVHSFSHSHSHGPSADARDPTHVDPEAYPTQSGHNDARDAHVPRDPLGGMTALRLLQRHHGHECPAGVVEWQLSPTAPRLPFAQSLYTAPVNGTCSAGMRVILFCKLLYSTR